jgi:hypothetical protein
MKNTTVKYAVVDDNNSVVALFSNKKVAEMYSDLLARDELVAEDFRYEMSLSVNQRSFRATDLYDDALKGIERGTSRKKRFNDGNIFRIAGLLKLYVREEDKTYIEQQNIDYKVARDRMQAWISAEKSRTQAGTHPHDTGWRHPNWEQLLKGEY